MDAKRRAQRNTRGLAVGWCTSSLSLFLSRRPTVITGFGYCLSLSLCTLAGSGLEDGG